MNLIPPKIKFLIRELSDLQKIPPVPASIYKTHLEIEINPVLAEGIPLEFTGHSNELKWKVMELIKVPIEEVLYAYSAAQKTLYLLNKQIWQEPLLKLNHSASEIEKVSLAGVPLQGLPLTESVLSYSQITRGLKWLGVSALVLTLLCVGLWVSFKAPSYSTLTHTKEISQTLKQKLNTLLETEKELSLNHQKALLQKKWLKTFKNLPQSMPAWVKLAEISLEETGQSLLLKGESKDQNVLQNWSKQWPGFEMTQIQRQTSANAGYFFTAKISYEN